MRVSQTFQDEIYQSALLSQELYILSNICILFSLGFVIFPLGQYYITL